MIPRYDSHQNGILRETSNDTTTGGPPPEWSVTEKPIADYEFMKEGHNISQCASDLSPKRLVPVRVDTQKKYLRFSEARNNSPPLSCSTIQTGLPPIVFARRFFALLDLGLTVTFLIGLPCMSVL
jgi:hypothetical protein